MLVLGGVLGGAVLLKHLVDVVKDPDCQQALMDGSFAPATSSTSRAKSSSATRSGKASGHITGVVVDGSTRAPLAGVSVRMFTDPVFSFSERTRTDHVGRFSHKARSGSVTIYLERGSRAGQKIYGGKGTARDLGTIRFYRK